MKKEMLAIVNRAAGGGRAGKLYVAALDKLRASGIKVDAVNTAGPGDASHLARDGYAKGYRNFISVGGDGTGNAFQQNHILVGMCRPGEMYVALHGRDSNHHIRATRKP